jgi:hypothetical protein
MMTVVVDTKTQRTYRYIYITLDTHPFLCCTVTAVLGPEMLCLNRGTAKARAIDHTVVVANVSAAAVEHATVERWGWRSRWRRWRSWRSWGRCRW